MALVGSAWSKLVQMSALHDCQSVKLDSCNNNLRSSALAMTCNHTAAEWFELFGVLDVRVPFLVLVLFLSFLVF